MPEFRQTSRGAVVLDDRHAPLLIATFLGETDLTLGKWFTDASKRLIASHAAAGRSLFFVADATRARKPSPEMRRFWADMSSDSMQTMKLASFGTFVVINNPVLRGAITAIGWLSPSLRDIETFPTLDDALREASVRLIRAGVPLPKLGGSYQLPEVAQKAQLAFAG